MEQMLISPSEAARVISVSRSTVYRLLSSGDLPSVRVSTAIRVPVDGLKAWIASKTDGGVMPARG